MREKQLLEKVYEVMTNTPLCPRCLGRMFASLLRGYSNRDRGLALLRSLVMSLEYSAAMGDENALEKLKKLAPSLPEEFRQTLDKHGIDWSGPPKCWLCGDRVEEWIKLGERVEEMLVRLRADSFVVGVNMSKTIAQKEDELYRINMVTTGESIRQEVKREVGKLAMARSGVPVEFEKPGVTIMITLPQGIVYPRPNPLLLKGRYLKTGRNISQTDWSVREGGRRFEKSVQSMLEPLRTMVGGTELVLHASGREDTDARMLGDGRPMIVEVKEPKRRRVDPKVVESIINTRQKWGHIKLLHAAAREEVRELKTSGQHRLKAYRALIATEEPPSSDALKAVEASLTGALVKQRTPQRVVHRRADMVREKRVYMVKLRHIAPRLIQAYILAEGGLYIKELVSGDGGRTHPSISSLLGTSARCVELDVVWVEEDKVTATTD